MTRIAFSLLLSVFSFCIFGQGQLGLRLENYAGINSAAINPAAIAEFPLRWDLNLVEGYGHAFTDYGFLQQTTFRNALDQLEAGTVALAEPWDDELSPGPDDLVLDFPLEAKRRYALLGAGAMGPSFQYNFLDVHSVGFSARYRVFAGSKTVPAAFNYPNYYTEAFFEDLRVDPFQVSALAVQQFGLHYALQLPVSDGYLAAGISAHYLVGNEAMYLENESTFVLQKVPGDSINFTSANLSYAYTLPDEDEFGPQPKGRGASFDLGVQYLATDAPGEPYRWKIGVSLLDIGGIRFRETAEAYRINTPSFGELGADDFERFEDLDQSSELQRVLSHQLFGDSLATAAGNDFSMSMPTSIGLQGGVQLHPLVFVSGAWRHQIFRRGRFAHQPDFLAVVPRFEHRWGSLSIPLSVVEYDQVNLGIAARLGFIVVGTDHLLAFTSERDLRGADFYFALKVNPFDLGLGGKKSNKKKWGGNGKVSCPTW